VPLTSGDRGGILCQDTRQFKFAIICMRCTLKFATMQETRIHFQDCPFGKPIDVMCGHCELRTSLWPAMCAHLNQPGMQKQVACKPEYRMTLPQRVEFTQEIQPWQPPASPMAMTVLGHSECASPGRGIGRLRFRLLCPQPDRKRVASDLHSFVQYCCIGSASTQAIRDCEGLGRWCPSFPWSELRDGVTACQPPPRGAPEI